jgi:hypothetical protein
MASDEPGAVHSIFLPFFRAATIHLGFAPRPAQVSPDGLRYFGGTFVPFNDDLPEALDLAPPTQPSASLALREAQAIVCQPDLVGSAEPQRSFLRDLPLA